MAFDPSRHQRAIWLAVALLAAFELIPPWHFILTENGQPTSISAGYALVFAPPEAITREPVRGNRRTYQPRIDSRRLWVQCGVVVIALGLWIAISPRLASVGRVDRRADWLAVAVTAAAVVGFLVLRTTYPAFRIVPGIAIGLAWWVWYERRSKHP